MPNFKYNGILNDGSPTSGVIEAYDEFEAVDLIKQTCRVVTSVKEVDDPNKKTFSLNMEIGKPHVSEKSLALMSSQFAIVLKAGMPIVRCVELIAEQTTDKTLKKILMQVAEDVETGHGLAQSFENKAGDILPTTLIETVRAGEESGSLDVSFAKLHVYYDKSSKTKAKVKSAMIYPAFLAVIAVIVIAIVLMVAMPVFIDMFEGMDMELPGITLFVMGLSDFFSKYWLIILAVIVVLVIALKTYSNTESGRLNFAKLQLKIPIIGSVGKMNGASQFANTMTTMIYAGLPIVRAVEITSRTMDNYHHTCQLGKSLGGLEEGKTLASCLTVADCFPELLVEMTSVGEETGTLETTLETIGEYFDSETAIASERALSALQPAITIVMGVVIGFIVIALYLPMFTMYGGM